MLDHPEEMWQNYYRYYRRRMTPKVDVRLVIAVTISVISFIQYYSAWSNYEEAIKYLVTVPKYRIQATEIAKGDGLLKRDKKADKGKSKDQIKEEDERVIRKVTSLANLVTHVACFVLAVLVFLFSGRTDTMCVNNNPVTHIICPSVRPHYSKSSETKQIFTTGRV